AFTDYPPMEIEELKAGPRHQRDASHSSDDPNQTTPQHGRHLSLPNVAVTGCGGAATLTHAITLGRRSPVDARVRPYLPASRPRGCGGTRPVATDTSSVNAPHPPRS